MSIRELGPPDPFFLTSRGVRLFAALRRGVAGEQRGLGLVVCPPLLDEHIACYRILYELSDLLAARGVSVLRFDPPGQGDSQGELTEATPERIAAAATDAARALRERSPVRRVGFLGARLGCPAALAAAAAEPDGFCVAWAPILSPERYFRDLLRRQVLSGVMYGAARQSVSALLEQLRSGAEVDAGGYLLTGALYDAYCATDVVSLLQAATRPVLLVQRESPAPECPAPLMEQAAKAATAHFASDEEVFWNFPREGSPRPAPTSWCQATAEWIVSLDEHAAGAG